MYQHSRGSGVAQSCGVSVDGLRGSHSSEVGVLLFAFCSCPACFRFHRCCSLPSFCCHISLLSLKSCPSFKAQTKHHLLQEVLPDYSCPPSYPLLHTLHLSPMSLVSHVHTLTCLSSLFESSLTSLKAGTSVSSNPSLSSM